MSAQTTNIVDEARALIVRVLDIAAIKYPPNSGSYRYLAGMANKVRQAEAATIDSYLVLDCVIAAITRARGERE